MTREESFWKYCFNFGMRRSRNKDIAEDFAQEAWIYCYRKMWHPSVHDYWRNFCREDIKRAGSYSTKSWTLRKRKGGFQTQGGGYMDYLEHSVSSSDPEQWGTFVMKNLSDRQRIVLFLLEAGWTQEILLKSFPEIDLSEILQSVRTQMACDDGTEVVPRTSKGIRALERERSLQEIQKSKRRVAPDSICFEIHE